MGMLRPGTFILEQRDELELEGCTVKVDLSSSGYDLEEGDLYVAERNTGPKLLTCHKVVRSEDSDSPYGGWVSPKEEAYAYDCNECKKVISIDGDPIT